MSSIVFASVREKEEGGISNKNVRDHIAERIFIPVYGVMGRAIGRAIWELAEMTMREVKKGLYLKGKSMISSVFLLKIFEVQRH